MSENREEKKWDAASSAVQKHLEIMQGVISRMSTNSSSLKTWCITIVSAILVLAANKNNPDSILIALIPIVMFCGLDMHYRALDRGFRKAHENFVCKLHNETLAADDMYIVKPLGNIWSLWIRAFLSNSIWPFYIIISIMILLARRVVLGGITPCNS